MSARGRGLIVGVGGLFAGALASQLVDWATLPKAALTAVVTVAVALVLSALLRPKPSA